VGRGPRPADGLHSSGAGRLGMVIASSGGTAGRSTGAEPGAMRDYGLHAPNRRAHGRRHRVGRRAVGGPPREDERLLLDSASSPITSPILPPASRRRTRGGWRITAVGNRPRDRARVRRSRLATAVGGVPKECLRETKVVLTEGRLRIRRPNTFEIDVVADRGNFRQCLTQAFRRA
jgi:hypothetical protein